MFIFSAFGDISQNASVGSYPLIEILGTHVLSVGHAAVGKMWKWELRLLS